MSDPVLFCVAIAAVGAVGFFIGYAFGFQTCALRYLTKRPTPGQSR